MIACVVILKEIAKYQKWGQLEKASAFEKSYAIKNLEKRLEALKDENILQLKIEKYISMKIPMNRLKTENATRKDVIKKVGAFVDAFLKATRKIHAEEELEYLEPLTKFFDMRNWKTSAFEAEDQELNQSPDVER